MFSSLAWGGRKDLGRSYIILLNFAVPNKGGVVKV
jgi:hypothetical protein